MPVCLDSDDFQSNYTLYQSSYTTESCFWRKGGHSMFLPCGGAKYCKLTGNYTGICTTYQHDQVLVELYPEEECDQKNYDISIEKCIPFNFQNKIRHPREKNLPE